MDFNVQCFVFFMPLGSLCCQVFLFQSRILLSLIEIKVSKTLYNFHKITMDSLVTLTLLIKACAMAFCCS